MYVVYMFYQRQQAAKKILNIGHIKVVDKSRQGCALKWIMSRSSMYRVLQIKPMKPLTVRS